ncbi:MAG: hypothetical protein IPJ34_26000 [Myxococcales bacterium]|nr:hypothetical protein [Myxococcales bacterium]
MRAFRSRAGGAARNAHFFFFAAQLPAPQPASLLPPVDAGLGFTTAVGAGGVVDAVVAELVAAAVVAAVAAVSAEAAVLAPQDDSLVALGAVAALAPQLPSFLAPQLPSFAGAPAAGTSVAVAAGFALPPQAASVTPNAAAAAAAIVARTIEELITLSFDVEWQGRWMEARREPAPWSRAVGLPVGTRGLRLGFGERPPARCPPKSCAAGAFVACTVSRRAAQLQPGPQTAAGTRSGETMRRRAGRASRPHCVRAPYR